MYYHSPERVFKPNPKQEERTCQEKPTRLNYAATRSLVPTAQDRKGKSCQTNAPAKGAYSGRMIRENHSQSANSDPSEFPSVATPTSHSPLHSMGFRSLLIAPPTTNRTNPTAPHHPHPPRENRHCPIISGGYYLFDNFANTNYNTPTKYEMLYTTTY